MRIVPGTRTVEAAADPSLKVMGQHRNRLRYLATTNDYIRYDQ